MSIVLELFRVLAACTSLFMILSPIPMVYKMHKAKDVGVMSIVPLAAVFLDCHTWYVDPHYYSFCATASRSLALSTLG
jgi:hypothetical protein